MDTVGRGHFIETAIDQLYPALVREGKVVFDKKIIEIFPTFLKGQMAFDLLRQGFWYLYLRNRQKQNKTDRGGKENAGSNLWRYRRFCI